MARSSYRLDMKRDDPRTLMIKMDARLTFAGRERNHAFRMEEERELRHLDYARHLTRATLERQQGEMHKRMTFLKNLVEENRARRKRRESDERNDCDVEKDATIDADDGKKADEKRKRKENSLRQTLPIIPARRNLEDLVNSLQQRKKGDTSSMSRSLGYLSESLSRDGTKLSLSERRLRQLRQEMREAKQKELSVPKLQVSSEETPADLPTVVWARAEGTTDVDKRGERVGVANQIISLPDISPGGKKANGFTGRRVSLSQMIASGEITKLPGINPSGGNSGVAASGAQQNLNLARTFYMNTSQASGRDGALKPIAQQSNKNGVVKLPSNMIPPKFLQEDVEHNPFITADFKPEIVRTRELLDSNKPDEMYVWLGFESEEEYLAMVKEANEELDAEKDDEEGDPDVVTELVENTDIDVGVEKEGGEYSRRNSRRFSRQVLRLSAPVAMMASSFNQGMTTGNERSTALKKFIRAAKTICIVRQFQMNGAVKQK